MGTEETSQPQTVDQQIYLELRAMNVALSQISQYLGQLNVTISEALKKPTAAKENRGKGGGGFLVTNPPRTL